MNRNLVFASVLALMAGGALAQEAAPAAETPTAPAAAAASETPAAPAEAAAADATEAAPEARMVGEFGDWTVMCADTGNGETCIARQIVPLTEEESGPKLFVFLEKMAENAPLNLTIGTPLGVSLPAGVAMITEEGQPAPVWQADFQSCIQEMCTATGIVNEPVLLASAEPAVVFTPLNGAPVGLKFSTVKADEAIAALLENAPAPATAETPAADAPAEAPAATPEAPVAAPAAPAEAAPAE